MLESKSENVTGLAGTSYAVFAVLPWNENGLRQGVSAAKVINIKDPSIGYYFTKAIFSALVIAGLLLYVFIFRKSGKSKSAS